MGKAADKGKKKKKATRTSPRKQRDEESQDSFPESEDETLQDQPHGDTDSDRSRPGRPGRQDVDKSIAQFFAARPYFYDLGNEHYKNRAKKDSELATFAATIGMDGEYNIFYFIHIFLIFSISLEKDC
jgi:hypothetical protein